MATESARLRPPTLDYIICPICLEVMKNPKALPCCLHTFCLHCLEHNFQDKLPEDIVSCPVCRQDFTIPVTGLDGLVHNFYIPCLVEATKQLSRRDSLTVMGDKLLLFTKPSDVNIVSSKAASRLLTKNLISNQGHELPMSASLPPPRAEATVGRTLYVYDVLSELCDILLNHLENKRCGGGEIEHFDYNESSHTATVTFVSPQIAEYFLAKTVITVAGYTMGVTDSLPLESPLSESLSYSDDEDQDSIEAFSSRSVFIENVPEDMLLFLEPALESKKNGGGMIESFKPNEGKGGVLVTFEDEQVAQQLLAAGKVMFGSTVLTVTEPKFKDKPPSPSPVDDNVIQVSGIPKSMSRAPLITFLEAGGGEVLEAVYTEGQDSAFVRFQDPEVAQHLLEAGKVQHKQAVLLVTRPRYDRDNEKSAGSNEAAPSSTAAAVIDTVEVRNVSPQLSVENLVMFFENKRRSGGGEITKVDCIDSSTVHITFRDPQVVESLLAKGEVEYGGTVMHIVKPSEHQPVEPRITLSDIPLSIEVRGIPKSMHRDTFVMFLENKRRSGGGTVEDFEFDDTRGTATVTFKDDQVAERLLEKHQLEFPAGNTLTLVRSRASEIHRASGSTSTASTPSPSTNAGGGLRSPRTLQVNGLVKEVGSDQLLLYFENKRRSGGGLVQEVLVSGESALVTFVEPNDALRVAQKSDHSLSNTKLTVVLLDMWPESTTCAVKVAGFSKGTTHEMVELLFENTRRSGGGQVQEVWLDEENGAAVITFKSREVAGRVASRNDLSLNNANLLVEWLKPGRPPPLCLDTSKVSAECLLFVDLPTNVQPEYLRKYASNAGGGSVTGITYSPRPGIALINYSSPPDYEKVRMAVCSEPCCGQMISVQRLPLTTSVQVHNIGALSLETLELYFENWSRGGGDAIVHSESGNGYYILEFENTQVMERVIRQNHELRGQRLEVRPYFPSFGILPPEFDSSRPVQSLPSDVHVDYAPEKVHFILMNRQFKDKIEEMLKCRFCFVRWPCSRLEKLTLHCIVNPQWPDAYAHIQNWSSRCIEIMQKELDSISLLNEEVSQEIWSQLKQKVMAEVTCNPEQILVHYDDTGAVIHVCGLHNHVDKYLKVLQKVRTELEKELEKSKRRITESIQLKPHHLYLLGTLDISSMCGTKELDVKLTEKGVVLVGQSQDVVKVKLELLQKVSSLTSSSLDQVSPALMKRLSKPAFKAHIQSLFAECKLQVTYDVQSGQVMVYGFEQKDVVSAMGILKSLAS